MIRDCKNTSYPKAVSLYNYFVSTCTAIRQSEAASSSRRIQVFCSARNPQRASSRHNRHFRYFRHHPNHFLLKTTTFRTSAIIQTFAKYGPCHKQLQLPQMLQLPQTMMLDRHQVLHLPRTMRLMVDPTSFTLCEDQLILQRHEILRLPPTIALMVNPRHICNFILTVRGAIEMRSNASCTWQ